MTLTEMEQSIRNAKAELDRADIIAGQLARLLVGRLRKVDSSWVLSDLKRELQKFNMHTSRWND